MAKKVLIIDDDPDIVDAQKIILEAHGYEVVTASDGKKGIETAKAETPSLIILDVMMATPDEGFQVAYHLKSDPALQRTPVLMVTSVGEVTGFKFNPKKDEDFIPVSAYMEKPIKAEVLIKNVEKLIGEA
ncbi:MAG: response regulator [Planctomycetes bacterium]|nr:response regulator [Planctomycetota bacterium]